MNEEIEMMDGLPVRSEKIEFELSQLIACGVCGRSNAPNRAECIYCGTALHGNHDASTSLILRDVEAWEKAYNLVLIDNTAPEVSTVPDQLNAEMIRQAIGLGPPTPIGRAATAEMAAAVKSKLDDSSLKTVVISDQDLNIDRHPVRLRSLYTGTSEFILTTFNTNERLEFSAGSLKLIVIGRLYEERFEQTLKKKRVGVKEIEGRNVSKDSGVIDIYFDEEPNGFRITESGFDFSGLAERKGLLAAENMKRLFEELKILAPSVVVSDDYAAKRNILDKIWPSTIRNDSKGVQRAKFGLTLEKSEVTTNLEQFTKYSRLVNLTI